MPINYNPIDVRGTVANEILAEVMFQTPTISQGIVTFEDDVKANTIFSEIPAASVTQQAYTSGAPSASGTMSVFDTIITPAKVMYYAEFDPETLRFSRFKRDMKAGAWEVISDEFQRLLIAGEYASRIALDYEYKFWNNATAATKTAVAALTAGTASTSVSTQEKALVASFTTGEFDGLITKVIYNSSNPTQTAGVGGRVKVVGSTKDASNIKAQYDLKYMNIPAELIHSPEQPVMYVPFADKALINIYNNNVANFKDAFEVSGNNYSFNGIEIIFVNIPANVCLIGSKKHFKLLTDLISDVATLKIDRIANNQEKWFIKSIMTCAAHVVNQKFNVLYVS